MGIWAVDAPFNQIEEVLLLARVPVSELRPVCDPASFNFETTADVEPYQGLIGQDRAVDALKFGLSIEGNGFNICVSGEPGTGRTTAIREYLQSYADRKPPPDEWCYVHNFADQHRPRALRLPPGRGREFTAAMAAMITEAKDRIPLTFQSDDFVAHRDEIVNSVQRERNEVFSRLASEARKSGFQLQGNPSGFFLVPLKGDEPMDDAAFGDLPEDERKAIMTRREELMEQLREALKVAASVEAEATARLTELQRSIATTAVDSLLDPLFERFEGLPDVVQFLAEVRKEMIENIEQFQSQPQAQAPGVPQIGREIMSPLRKYEVNLLVDCTDERCAVVVFESNPTPQRLFGRIEKEALFGAVSTDHTMLRAGSLHQANGGFLVVDFDDVLQYPLSWNELKRTIRTGELTIEEMGEKLGYIETKTLRPEPIPWTGKIVAISRDDIYRMLYTRDPDFRALFKVKADFDMHIDRTPEHEQAFAGLMAAVTKREGLLPLDKGAVARVIEESMRLVGDHNKLSIRFGDLTDIIREAVHWARQADAPVVKADHVSHAISERDRRVSLVEEHIREAIYKDIIVVDTAGEAIGQVNGLSVVDLGDTAFGQPARITATIGMGREGVVDLQREARLSGPIHSKAVLTLQGFLVDRYAVDTPLTLAARLSFEQSYGMIEGDSATVAETCALLSRLAEAPLKQSFAITGSMDQRGEVQAIGGVNQKVEGFFDVCKSRGLTGEQGVIIPASNVQHLMVRKDVLQAVEEGKFAVHSARTIDEALELLTGVEAGSRREDGSYPPDSLNGRVLARLTDFAKRLRDEGKDEDKKGPEEEA
ncbi:MAG: AAA family ATPase [Dehalococcoidia bacterium]|nr:AAA family ATPase [Dehalococcoidia bacterium]